MITRTIPVGHDRVLALDDVGDPDGVPVVFLHGTPDSRLGRHPDDRVAAAAGVRLLAVDRPGYGASSPLPPGRWPRAVVDALGHLGIGRCAVLAWSGGALDALALAVTVPDRVGALGIVGGLVPHEAYDDPDVRAAGAARVDLADMADGLAPGELGEMVAPMLAPHPCDLALATEHQREQRSAFDDAELASVAGGAARMATALVEGVRPGLHGVAADLEAQTRPSGLDLGTISCPTRLWYGANDTVTPPVFGGWLARQIPHARLEVIEDAGHYVLMTRWDEILTEIAALV